MCKGNPVWHVIDAQLHKDYTITVSFHDGSTRLFDAKPLLEIPIYEPLKNPGFFMTGRADHGTVIWNEDLDVAPEYLYDAGKIIN